MTPFFVTHLHTASLCVCDHMAAQIGSALRRSPTRTEKNRSCQCLECGVAKQLTHGILGAGDIPHRHSVSYRYQVLYQMLVAWDRKPLLQ